MGFLFSKRKALGYLIPSRPQQAENPCHCMDFLFAEVALHLRYATHSHLRIDEKQAKLQNLFF